MKNKMYKYLLLFSFVLSSMGMSASAFAHRYDDGGYRHHQKHWRHHGRVHCRWVPAHRRHGQWVPAHRKCARYRSY